MQPNKKYIYGSDRHKFTSYPTSKHPKHSQLSFTNNREKSVLFSSLHQPGATLAIAKTLPI